MKTLLFSTVCAAVLAGSTAFALADEPDQNPAGTPTIGQTLHDQSEMGQTPYQYPQLHKGARGTQPNDSRTPQAAQNEAPQPQPQQGAEAQSTLLHRRGGTQTASLPHGKGSATRALNTLQANGYNDYSNFHRSGRNYEATVTTESGQSAKVMIDPTTGTVSRED